MSIADKIVKLQKQYLYEFESLKEEDILENKINKACILANNLTYNAAGIYYSKAVEDVFLELANTKTVNCDEIKYKKNTFLHVLTIAHTTGGHTRVVEKWIQQANSEESHSVIVLQQGSIEFPDCLSTYAHEKNGSIILVEENKLIDRALILRKLASEYEYIILHVHMDDPTAIVAFGHREFSRPVLLYNHASHLFWLGKSICDKLIDIKKDDFITINKREIKDSFYLGIPIDLKVQKKIKKKDARKILSLPQNKQIIITAGSSQKFSSFCGLFIGDTLLDITLSNDNILIIVIGADEEDINWKKIKNSSDDKIIILPKVDYHKEYFLYIRSADIILDSWPLSGWTVVIDALSNDIPVLCLETPFGSSDYIENSIAFCTTTTQLIEKVNMLFSNSLFKKKVLAESKTAMLQDIGHEAWHKKMTNLFENAPVKHTIKRIASEQHNIEIDTKAICLFYLYNNLENKNKKLFPTIYLHQEAFFYHKEITLYICNIKTITIKYNYKTQKFDNIFFNYLKKIYNFLKSPFKSDT